MSELPLPLPRRAFSLLQTAARFVGQTALGAYRAVDPDLRRHLAELPLLGLTLLTPRRRPLVPLPDDGHRPVVFVHGLGGHRGNFLGLHGWLRAHGRRRLYSVDLTGGASVSDLGERLRSEIARVLEVNALPADAQVDLIAHSMGGLVARCALEDERTAARVATLVTLGSPHAGSQLARYLATEQVLSLRPSSALMERLARQLPWSGPSRLVCFWSSADVILLPHDSARVEGAENVELEGVTHYGYLVRPACFRAVRSALDGVATAPAPHRIALAAALATSGPGISRVV